MPKRKKTNLGNRGRKRKINRQSDDSEDGLTGTALSKSDLESLVAKFSSVFEFSSPEGFFRSFIAPFSDKDFFEQYWEKKPLHISGRDQISGVAKDIFSRYVLVRLVHQSDIHYLRDVCASRYLNGVREDLNEGTKIRTSQLKKLLDRENATIQFHQPQRFQNILWKMMEQLETRFGCLFGANVYITPKGSQGLAPHYDDVEVFVLQLEGEKHWHLYKPPQELPRDYSKDLSQGEIGEPTHSVTLQPGDLLYFPRGTVHQAAVSDSCSHSTHITFSTYQHHTMADYLSRALPKMLGPAFESDVSFRCGLPVGSMTSSRNLDANTKSLMEGLVRSLAKEVETTQEQALQDLRLNFIANRLPPYLDSCYSPLIDDVEEMVIRPEGSHLTGLRLKHPNHTCVVVACPGDQSLFLPDALPDTEEEEDESSDEESENGVENGGRRGDGEEGVFHVYHSLHNDRRNHMMSTQRSKPTGYVFPMRLLPLFRLVEAAKGQWLVVQPKDPKEQSKEMIFGDLVEYKYGETWLQQWGTTLQEVVHPTQSAAMST